MGKSEPTNYKCPDCGWTITTRASRLRCSGCGSLNLERQLPDGRWWKADAIGPDSYVDISAEQRRKLPSDFTLYACPKCECSLFAIDQDILEAERTKVCCLGCGDVIIV